MSRPRQLMRRLDAHDPPMGAIEAAALAALRAGELSPLDALDDKSSDDPRFPSPRQRGLRVAKHAIAGGFRQDGDDREFRRASSRIAFVPGEAAPVDERLAPLLDELEARIEPSPYD